MSNVTNAIPGGSDPASEKFFTKIKGTPPKSSVIGIKEKGEGTKPSFCSTVIGYTVRCLELLETPGLKEGLTIEDGVLKCNFTLPKAAIPKYASLISSLDPSIKLDEFKVPGKLFSAVGTAVKAIEASGGKLHPEYSTDGGISYTLEIPLSNVRQLLSHPLVEYLFNELYEADKGSLQSTIGRLADKGETKPSETTQKYSPSDFELTEGMNEVPNAGTSTLRRLDLLRQQYIEAEAKKLGIGREELASKLHDLTLSVSEKVKASQIEADLKDIAPDYVTDPSEAAERIVHYFTNLAARGKSGAEVVEFLERHGGPNKLQEAVVARISANAEAREQIEVQRKEAREKELDQIALRVSRTTTLLDNDGQATFRAVHAAIVEHAKESGLSVSELSEKLGYSDVNFLLLIKNVTQRFQDKLKPKN